MKYFLLAAAVVLLLMPSVNAQKPEIKQKQTAEEKMNFINGINSDNTGLCKSCIIYAGIYNIPETSDCLVDVLKNKNDEDLRMLAAVSIYLIGMEKGLSEIYSVSLNGDNEKVKKFCSLLLKNEDVKRLNAVRVYYE